MNRFQLAFLGFQLGWFPGEAAVRELQRDLDAALLARGGRRPLYSDTVYYFCQVRRGLPAALKHRLVQAPRSLFQASSVRARLLACVTP
jgi:hypothetical protein